MKRVLSMLVALLMVLVPTLSLANQADTVMEQAIANGKALEAVVRFSIGDVPGADEQSMTVLKDLLDAFSITAYKQQDQAGLSYNLSGESVAHVDFAKKDSVPYVASNLLGTRAISLHSDDLVAMVKLFVNYALDAAVENGEITAAEAAQAKAELEKSLGEVGQQMTHIGEIAVPDFSDLTFERTAEAFSSVLGNIYPSKEPLQLEDCDPANVTAVITITGEQIQKVTIAFLQDLENTTSLMGFADNLLLETEGDQYVPAAQLIDQLIAQVEGDPSFKNMEPTKITMNLDEEGEVVGAVVTQTVKDGDETETTDVVYTRKTEGTSVRHRVHFAAQEVEADEPNDQDSVEMDFSLLMQEDSTVFSFNASEDGKTIMYMNAVCVSTEGENKANSTWDIELGVVPNRETVVMHVTVTNDSEWNATDATKKTQVKFSIDGLAENLFTMTVDVATTDVKPVIGTADAVKLSVMTEEEIKAFGQQITTTATMQVLAALQYLPASIQALMFQ